MDAPTLQSLIQSTDEKARALALQIAQGERELQKARDELQRLIGEKRAYESLLVDTEGEG